MPFQIAAAAALLTALSTSAGASPQAQAAAQPQLYRLVVGKSPSDSVTSARSGRSWKLGSFNKTTDIDAAYRYDHTIIVFGGIGSNIEVTTIINAATSAEQFEFLDYDPHITPNGLIVFERWYPHFSDPSIVSDAIAELDLKQPIPHNVPSGPDENPTEQVGTTIYPKEPTPGIRHDIGHNFVITDSGTLLFLVDRLSTGKLCLVRLSLVHSTSDQGPKENCLGPASFGVADWPDLHIRPFSENTFGDLILSTDVGGPNLPTQRDFEVDKTSLSITPINTNPQKAGGGPLPVPWPVQRAALASFVPLDVTAKSVAAYAQDAMKARIVIDRDGAVREATVSGLPDALSKLIRDVILQWRFDPTILDGKHVEVATEFTSQVGKLTKIPD